MILSKKMEELLNKQMNSEFYSSHLYLAMAAWFESQNLTGFAKWMEVQAEEERTHAMKFYNYIKERRGKIKISQIPELKSEYKNTLELFQEAFNHEENVTKQINGIIEAAYEEKDYASVEFLNWFIKEQVEEEASIDSILQQLKMIGESKGSLFYIDRHMAKRKEN